MKKRSSVVSFVIHFVFSFLFVFSCFSISASAQSKDKTAFQLQQFRPWLDPRGMFHTQSATTLGQWNYNVGLFLNYAKDPLTLRNPDRSIATNGHLVEHQIGADLGFGIGFTSWLDLMVVLPMSAYQIGALPNIGMFGDQAGSDLTGFFLSDVKLALKFGFLKEEKHGANVALQVYATAPTALLGKNKAFNGEDSFSAGAFFLVSKELGSFMNLAFSVGYRYMPLTELQLNSSDASQTLVLEHEINYGLGLAIHAGSKVDIIGEVYGRMNVNKIFLDSAPLEGLLGVRIFPMSGSKNLAINLGGGAGFYQGYGSPLFRVFFGLVYATMDQDSDKDGIVDSKDKCPTVPGPKENKGCPWPDTDRDGLTDNIDKCPNDAGPKENQGCPWGDKDGDGVKDNADKCPDVPGDKDNAGCPWGDKDGDGVKDNVDKCPNVPGPKENDGCPWGDKDGDGIKDNVDKCPDEAGPKENDGCPDKDRDGDGIIDRLDKCPDVPGVKSRQGCPRVVLVKVTKGKIYILKKIFFNTASAKIKRVSYPILNQVVQVMKSNPSIQVQVEGHTDNVGRPTYNLNLSKRRAASVRQYLIQKGVDSSRLTSEGFGFERPLVPNTSRFNKAKNRRVEFTILKR